MKNRTLLIIIAVLAAGLVVVSGLLVRQVYFVAAPTPAPQPSNKNTNTVVNEYSNPNPDNTPEPATPVTVNWIPGGQAMSASAFGQVFDIVQPDKEFSNVEYYKIGTINDGRYSGDALYIANGGADMEPPYPVFRALVIADRGQPIIVNQYSNFEQTTDKSAFPPVFQATKEDSNLTIAGLNAPDQITIGSGPYTAKRTGTVSGFPDKDTSIPVVGRTSDEMPVYDSGHIVLAGDLSAPRNDLALRLTNGEYVSYALQIPFYTDGRIPAVTWTGGETNDADYSNGGTGGCGGNSLLAIMPSLKLTDLKPAGKTSTGETVYVYKNTSNENLKIIYDSWLTWGGTNKTKPSYSAYLNLHPVFFWVDPLGRVVQWSRSDIGTGAECGKPVVYLYPTQTEKVSVKLGSNIDVTKSEPTYKNGWKVVADPNGILTTEDGKTYPYLYWDGNGASYQVPTTGAVVASKDVEATLTAKLTRLGLNAKEIADFNEFWVPIVSKFPYALISFVPQEEWNKAAPLAISPAPETVIRVFMDWKPLSAPISIAPQILPPTPVRTGFTAVEWGGLLYK